LALDLGSGDGFSTQSIMDFTENATVFVTEGDGDISLRIAPGGGGEIFGGEVGDVALSISSASPSGGGLVLEDS